MLQVSDKFKKSCNSDSFKYREYIIIGGKQVDIKGNLSATAYKDTTFFGTFNMKMLTFQTENDIDYKKKEFIYYKEVDGESAKIGTFIVTEVKDSDTFEQVNVTAYDYGLKFANPYKTNLDYASGKITMLDVIREICTNCNMELENTTLPNGKFIVDSNQFINDEQFGDVVAIASLENGMFATINENDKLEFIFTKTTIGNEVNLTTEEEKKLLTEDNRFIVINDLETIEDYVDLDDKRDTQPITSVLVATNKDLENAGAVRKDQELIDKYGEHWLKIYDYAFAYSSEKCEQLADAIFNQVKGFGYSSFESSYTFKPYLQLGDKVKFKNKEGKLVKSIILRIESNYDDITLSAPSIINASVEYDLPKTAEEIAERASIDVNKANAEIVLKVDSDGKIAQVRLDGKADDGSTFNVNADNIKLEGYTTVGDKISFNLDGSITAQDLRLGNGGKVIGGDGMMSVMIVNGAVWSKSFLGGSGFMPLGFEAYDDSGVEISNLLEFVIPSNFKPRKAFIYLRHVPLTSEGYFSGEMDLESYTGYARNVNAYICNDGSFARTISYAGQPSTATGNYNKINNCFGANGFTGKQYGISEAISIDIVNLIKNSGTYSIKIKSDYSTPSGFQNIYQATGSVMTQLYIYGYTSEEITDED